MNPTLPTAKELEKLPMRAIVAYVARTARRVSQEFRGVVADETLDEALRLIESVSTTDHIGKIDPAAIFRASERVVAGYDAAPDYLKSTPRFRLLFSLVQAGLAAAHAVEAVLDPNNAGHQIKRAALAAERAVRPIQGLNSVAAGAAREAARRDYELLFLQFGEHHQREEKETRLD